MNMTKKEGGGLIQAARDVPVGEDDQIPITLRQFRQIMQVFDVFMKQIGFARAILCFAWMCRKADRLDLPITTTATISRERCAS